ncbi:phosphotransferase family protein [Aggregatilineales bacterium SYSU G02658]
MQPLNDTQKHALNAFLSQALQPVTVTAAQPLSGGASRDTWKLTLQGADVTLEQVLRRDLPTQMFDEALTRAQEFHIMRVAHAHGVKVAKVRALCEDPTVLGSPFFVMDYVPGVSIGTKVIHAPELAAARERLPQQLAEQLARIHRLPMDELGFLPRAPEGTAYSRYVVDQMYALLDKLGVHNPVWEWTLRWAQNHLPTQTRTTVIHGDFRVGNLLVDEQGLAAVIDWEFAHIGDPNEELGYICMRDWRFRAIDRHFAGLSDRETFLQAYEAASGLPVDRQAVDWWEIMGNIRWGIICMSQANRHLSGLEPSVELASLGRRSAEMQLEALRLIELVR